MPSACSLTKDLDLFKFPLFKIHMRLSACRPRGPSFQLRAAAYTTDFAIYSNFLSVTSPFFISENHP